jgi:hypothetical protein
MKKMLFLVFAIANTVVYAQSKKKQIITLNSRVDSFRLALSNEIKLSNENSLKLNNRVDSFRLALLSERQSKLSNEKRDALKINNCKIEIENSEAALEAERNLNNILNNELKKKELIIDSLRAESNNITNASDFRFNLIMSNKRESPALVISFLADYKIQLLYGNSVIAVFDAVGCGYLTDEKDAVYIKTTTGSERTYSLKSNTIDEVSITQHFFLGSASIDRDVWTKTYKNYSHWELMRCEGDCE